MPKLLPAFIASAALAITAALVWPGLWLPYALLKTLTTLLVIAHAWRLGGQGTPMRTPLLAGLVLSLVGDVALLWPQQGFLPGLVSFLLAHLAYLRAYCSDCRQPAWLALMLALSIGASIFSLLANNGLGALLLPVACYALAISAMLWRALARLGTDVPERSALLAAAGALAFVFSDSVIGIDRFAVPFSAAPYVIIISYWLGQWGIAASAFSQSHRPEREQP